MNRTKNTAHRSNASQRGDERRNVNSRNSGPSRGGKNNPRRYERTRFSRFTEPPNINVEDYYTSPVQEQIDHQNQKVNIIRSTTQEPEPRAVNTGLTKSEATEIINNVLGEKDQLFGSAIDTIDRWYVQIDDSQFYSFVNAQYDVIKSTFTRWDRYASKIEFLLYMQSILRCHQISRSDMRRLNDDIPFQSLRTFLRKMAEHSYPKVFDEYFKCLGTAVDAASHKISAYIDMTDESVSVHPDVFIDLLKAAYYQAHPNAVPMNDENQPATPRLVNFETCLAYYKTRYPNLEILNQLSVKDAGSYQASLYATSFPLLDMSDDDYDPDENRFLYFDQKINNDVSTLLRLVNDKIKQVRLQDLSLTVSTATEYKCFLNKTTIERDGATRIQSFQHFSGIESAYSALYQLRTDRSEAGSQLPSYHTSALHHEYTLQVNSYNIFVRMCEMMSNN